MGSRVLSVIRSGQPLGRAEEILKALDAPVNRSTYRDSEFPAESTALARTSGRMGGIPSSPEPIGRTYS